MWKVNRKIYSPGNEHGQHGIQTRITHNNSQIEKISSKLISKESWALPQGVQLYLCSWQLWHAWESKAILIFPLLTSRISPQRNGSLGNSSSDANLGCWIPGMQNTCRGQLREMTMGVHPFRILHSPPVDFGMDKFCMGGKSVLTYNAHGWNRTAQITRGQIQCLPFLPHAWI